MSSSGRLFFIAVGTTAALFLGAGVWVLLDLMPDRSVTATKQGNWTNAVFEVHCTTKQDVERVRGKSCSYVLVGDAFGFVEERVSAFITERGLAWVGPEQDFHIEIGNEVLGGKEWIRDVAGKWRRPWSLGTGDARERHYLLWCESLLLQRPNEQLKLDQVIDRFDKEVRGNELAAAYSGWPKPSRMRLIPLSDLLSGKFWEPVSATTVYDRTIQTIQVTSDGLRLGLRSPDGGRAATVWIDTKSRVVVKAIESGKQVFPK